MEKEEEEKSQNVVHSNPPSEKNEENHSQKIVSKSNINVKEEIRDDEIKEKKPCAINPSKCCCKGNLRQVCFMIVFAEFLYEAEKEQPIGTGIIVIYIIMVVLVIALPISMLFATIGKKKCACLLHSVLSVLVSIVFLIFFIFTISALSNLPPEKETEKGKKPHSISNDDITAVGSVMCTSYFIQVGLVLYFGLNSAALFTQYRSGNLYKGTVLCPCCTEKHRKVKPQSRKKKKKNKDESPFGSESNSDLELIDDLQ